MKHQITTESGSLWELDDTALTWKRLVASEHAIRTSEGPLIEFPKIELGQPVFMFGPALTEGMSCRIVNTSAVVKHEIMEEVDVPVA